MWIIYLLTLLWGLHGSLKSKHHHDGSSKYMCVNGYNRRQYVSLWKVLYLQSELYDKLLVWLALQLQFFPGTISAKLHTQIAMFGSIWIFHCWWKHWSWLPFGIPPNHEYSCHDCSSRLASCRSCFQWSYIRKVHQQQLLGSSKGTSTRWMRAQPILQYAVSGGRSLFQPVFKQDAQSEFQSSQSCSSGPLLGGAVCWQPNRNE